MFCVFKCMSVFYPWNVYAAEPATDIDSLLNEQTSKQRKNGEPDIETTCIRIHVVFTFCLQFCLCICICCCFKRRWIQFTKMPGGRRGLVAPQNTFLENIIRRSNSQRKYLRFSFLSFFSLPILPLIHAFMCVVRLRNCKWLDQRRSKNENKKKSNEYVIKGETKESWTNDGKKRKRKIVNHKKFSQKSHRIDFDRKRKEKLKKVEWQVYRYIRWKKLKGWLDILLLFFRSW